MSRKCENWLKTYTQFTSNSESPDSFHYWTGISVLSAVIGRGIKIIMDRYNLYPNMYVLIVADSGIKKTSTLSIGKELLYKVLDQPHIFAQKLTPESLIVSLLESKTSENNCGGLLFAPELTTLINKNSSDNGLIQILTDLYDSPSRWDYRTIKRGLETITNITVSMLGATTPDELMRALPESAIGGGFTSRIIFVYCNKKKPPQTFAPKLDPKIMADLVSDLNEIRQIRASTMMTQEAILYLDNWYKNEHYYIQRDRRVAGYYNRKLDHVIKLATILCVAESNKVLLDKRHIEEALKRLEEVEESLGVVVSKVETNPIGVVTAKIKDIIKMNAPIQHAVLLTRVTPYVNHAKEMDEYLRTLIESHQIRTVLIDGKTHYV